MKKLLLVVLGLSIFSLQAYSAYTPMVNEAACINYCNQNQISKTAANKYKEIPYRWIPNQTQVNIEVWKGGKWVTESRPINTGGKCACLDKDGWLVPV